MVAIVGEGRVDSIPTGVSCTGGVCEATLAMGTQFLLVPTPADGATFVEWSGACTGNVPCTMTMDSAKAVTATFETVSQPAPTSPVSGAGGRRRPIGSAGLGKAAPRVPGSKASLNGSKGLPSRSRAATSSSSSPAPEGKRTAGTDPAAVLAAEREHYVPLLLSMLASGSELVTDLLGTLQTDVRSVEVIDVGANGSPDIVWSELLGGVWYVWIFTDPGLN